MASRSDDSYSSNTLTEQQHVVSKLKCPVLIASEVSGLVLLIKLSYQSVVTVEVWESQAAFWRDFPSISTVFVLNPRGPAAGL